MARRRTKEPTTDEASTAHLEDAATAAERATWEIARDALVVAWQQRPSTRVGRLVALLDDRLPKPMIESRTIAARDAHWLELALAAPDAVAAGGTDLPEHWGDPATLLTRLLSTPWPVHAKGATERVDALAKWPRSPRITHALLALHERRQYPSNTGKKLSRRIFNILIEQGDPAVAAYLDRLDDNRDYVDRDARSGLAAVMARRRPLDPEPTPRQLAALDRIEATLEPVASRATTRHELLQAVYAAPHDDEPRAVLADLLIETGDPRGELIVLQLKRHRDQRANPGDRERTLIRQTGNHWFDGLDRDGADGIELERGFPAIAVARDYTFRDPAWSTITTVLLGGNTPFRGGPTLTGLRRLHGLVVGELRGVTLPDPELDVLSVLGIDAIDAPTALAPRTLGLAYSPGITHVDWMNRVHVALAKLATMPVGRRTTTLRLGFTLGGLGLGLDLAATLPQLDEVVIQGTYDHYLRAQFHWTAQIARTHLRLAWHGPWSPSSFTVIAHMLAQLTPAAVARLRSIEVIAHVHVEDKQLTTMRNRLTAIVGTWPAITDAKILVATR